MSYVPAQFYGIYPTSEYAQGLHNCMRLRFFLHLSARYLAYRYFAGIVSPSDRSN